MRISWSGLAKRASSSAAWAETGVRARFLVGRLDRGSADVGMDSGPSPDMAAVWWDGCARVAMEGDDDDDSALEFGSGREAT